MSGHQLVLWKNDQVSKSSRHVDLRMMSAQLTLRNEKKKGHVYVELRFVGSGSRRPVFFCVLCLSYCYSERALQDHLNGRFHKCRYRAAELTLLGPNPWPFNDGVLFFTNSDDMDGHSLSSSPSSERDLIVSTCVWSGVMPKSKEIGRNLKVMYNSGALSIPRVHINGKVSSLRVNPIGYGEIGGRIYESDASRIKVSKIWCAWLGDEISNQDDSLPKCDFAIVVFPCTVDLGRKVGMDERKRKLLPDSEDYSSSLTDLLVPREYDFAGMAVTQGLEKQKAHERLCHICAQQMLPGKDVASLLNLKTRYLACNSRNPRGAFHVFHTSCLIHWVLFCESEIYGTVVRRRRKRKISGKKLTSEPFSSVFCPECRGTGVCICSVVVEDWEHVNFHPQIFQSKLKMIQAQKAWMRSPELLRTRSTGLHFPSQSIGNPEERVVPMKKLAFYQADI